MKKMIAHFKTIVELKMGQLAFAVLLIATTCCSVPAAFAVLPTTEADIESIEPDKDDPNFHTVTTKTGQRFRIPVDMELKKQGNVYIVEGMESYVYRRNATTQKEIESIQERLDAIEKKLGIVYQET